MRIAPPEAPRHGYALGKGAYFADMISKSINYCDTYSSKNIGFLVLCQIALGKSYKLNSHDSNADIYVKKNFKEV
jgi:poly [ADP-ribose] polymerase